MSTYDNPNQEVVRGSGPVAGGEGEAAPAPEPSPSGESDLDSMTKAELLELAKESGVSPANNDMTKDELKAALEAQP